MASDGKNSFSCLWRGAGLWYLGFCLAGLAAGLWSEAMLYPKAGRSPLPLPTLPALAAAQALFFLLVWPLAMLRRCETAGRAAERGGGCPITETAVLLVVSTPLYYVAAYFGDAVASDVLRVAMCVICVAVFSWSAGTWMCRGGLWRAAAGGLTVAMALGLPVMTYVANDMLLPQWADRLWQFTPATYLWQNGSPRAGEVLPNPLWPAIVCLAAAAGMFLLSLAVPRRAQATAGAGPDNQDAKHGSALPNSRHLRVRTRARPAPARAGRPADQRGAQRQFMAGL